MITKQEFDSLYSDEITKKQYNQIVEKIDIRFVEIIKILFPNKSKYSWFCYGNDIESFSPEDYKEDIQVCGENLNNDDFFDCYDCGYFPTRWLWEDFEKEYKQDISQFRLEKEKVKKAAADKRKLLKEKKIEMKAIIQSKLTKEELKYISFK